MTADPQPVPDAALTAALGGYYGHPTAITAADPDVIDGLTAGLAVGMAAIRKGERAKVAEELREQARVEAERLAPYRKGSDAIENAIVVWEFAANWIDPAVENHPPAKLTRGDAR